MQEFRQESSFYHLGSLAVRAGIDTRPAARNTAAKQKAPWEGIMADGNGSSDNSGNKPGRSKWFGPTDRDGFVHRSWMQPGTSYPRVRRPPGYRNLQHLV